MGSRYGQGRELSSEVGSAGVQSLPGPRGSSEGGSCPEGRVPGCWLVNGWGPPPEWAGMEYLCIGSSWRLRISWKRWQWEDAIHLLIAADGVGRQRNLRGHQ